MKALKFVMLLGISALVTAPVFADPPAKAAPFDIELSISGAMDCSFLVELIDEGIRTVHAGREAKQPNIEELAGEVYGDLLVYEKYCQRAIATEGAMHAVCNGLTFNRWCDARKHLWQNYTPPEES